MFDNEKNRFGSAAWADKDSVRKAGLLGDKGLPIGILGNRELRLEGDAPLITIGGAGSGKLRDLLGYVVCCSPGVPMLVNDPRGELGAISLPAHAMHGEQAFFWNPIGLSGLPEHRCNPLSILVRGSKTLLSDAKFIAEGLVPLSGSDGGQYFELRAREWIADLLIDQTEADDKASFPALMSTINVIEGDLTIWGQVLERMLRSPHDSVRRTAGEMLTKQQGSPKEFGSIMGSIYAPLSFLNDPVLLDALDGSDFDLSVLVDRTKQVSKVFLNIPAEFLSLWSPLVRVFFTATMLLKGRRPDAKRVTLICDEAGQLGRFEALLRAFTYGRGAGLRAWAIFQDIGQIERNYGRPALQGFLGSAQMRQFFGVRDYDTARLVSDMLGTETLEYNDTLAQDRARKSRADLVTALLDGGDVMEIAANNAHLAFAESHRSQQARKLLTPDEVLALPDDRQVLFISGKNLRPILAEKQPYFTRREMAGRYLPNPYHPPYDKVQIRTAWRNSWAPVITEPVPKNFASSAQYQSGVWSYVKGFRPKR